MCADVLTHLHQLLHVEFDMFKLLQHGLCFLLLLLHVVQEHWGAETLNEWMKLKQTLNPRQLHCSARTQVFLSVRCSSRTTEVYFHYEFVSVSFQPIKYFYITSGWTVKLNWAVKLLVYLDTFHFYRIEFVKISVGLVKLYLKPLLNKCTIFL